MKNELDFFVIGAMKSGTTSVHKYLSVHKDIFLPPEKEAPFFSEDKIYEDGYDKYLAEYFPSSNTYKLRGTVTPQYMLSSKAPKRLHKTCPNAKIIAILRDPIERAYSHYHMATRVWDENKTFDNAISLQVCDSTLIATRDEPNYDKDYVVFGEYGRILSKYYALFPAKQILVLEMSELHLNPENFMKRIFYFIGTDMPYLSNLGKKYHSSKINPLMSFFADLSFNSRLRIFGKLLPTKLRRRVSFWLGLYRTAKNKKVNTDPILSPELRNKLEKIYRTDALLIEKITGNKPKWIKKWKKN